MIGLNFLSWLDFLKPENRAEGEEQESSFLRPLQLQYAQRLLWTFCQIMPKLHTPALTCKQINAFFANIKI